jgi:hypothetical protein
MRIRVSDDVGGIIIMVLFALVLTGIVVWILDFLKKYLFKGEGAKKVFSWITGLLFAATIVFIVLDLIDIFPLYRNILFAILGD